MSLQIEAPASSVPEPGLWRNLSFITLALGTAVSLAGDALYTLVIPLWIIQATGSSSACAAVYGTASLVTLLVSPVAGTFADRNDRRRVMIVADTVRTLVLILLAVFMWRGSPALWHLTLAAASLSVAAAFFSPAYAAALSGLVHPKDLTQALAIFQLLRQVIMLTGSAMAGVLVSVAGNGTALCLDAGSFVVSALCICVIRLHWAHRPTRERKPFWRDLTDGVTTLVGNRVLVRTVVLGAGVNLVGGFFVVLLPVAAIRELHLAAVQYGLLNTANPAGIVAGMTILSLLAKRIEHRGRFMLWCLLAMGMVNALMGLLTNLWAFAALLFLGGLTFGLGNVMFASLYRELVPQEQQGRFFGMLGTLSQILVPVGITVGGVLGDHMSPFGVFGLGGTLIVCLALWGFMTPGLRNLR